MLSVSAIPWCASISRCHHSGGRRTHGVSEKQVKPASSPFEDLFEGIRLLFVLRHIDVVKAAAIGITFCESNRCSFASCLINVQNCNAKATARDQIFCYCKADTTACVMFSRSTNCLIGQTRTATCYYSHWRRHPLQDVVC